ncbi:MAG: phosphoribosylglycinamide synthetase C domain-containing protein [Pseudomonadota bacterium]
MVKGGRVFNVTAIGADLDEARGKALGVAQQLVWKGGFYRTDIGQMNATEKGL